jgi:hypothetical protein
MSVREKTVSALQMMVQTPTDLFVYWQVSREYLALAKTALPESASEIALILYRQEAEQSVETALVWLEDGQLDGTYYFGRQQPWKTYFAELALNCPEGFFTLLRSNMVVTPPVVKERGERPPLQLPWQTVPLKLPFAYSPSEERQGD